MFITILVLILATIYFITSYHPKLKKLRLNQDTFAKTDYPYNPPIQTPQTNYDKIIDQIDSQQAYKLDLSVALGPTPTIKCPELKNKSDCNQYGCNWFGTFCSSTYPTQV
jgi:hypothetical protein